MSAAMPFESPAQGLVSLVISGDPGARFDGHCTLTGPAGQEGVALVGTVPFRRDFEATGLSCQIAAWGGIKVEVYKGGSHMFWTTRNGTVSLSVS